jgi:hypothetical protein
MYSRSRRLASERADLVEARLRERSERLMAGEQRAPSDSFVYEPSCPPSIPPGLTIADWQAARRGVGRLFS